MGSGVRTGIPGGAKARDVTTGVRDLCCHGRIPAAAQQPNPFLRTSVAAAKHTFVDKQH